MFSMKTIFIVVLSVRSNGDIWAVLVAGSRGYQNYRHQADLCHTQLLLRTRGILDERLLSISVDDAAYSVLNPFPGQLFNAPSMRKGKNVHDGCNLTLSGSQVKLSSFKRLFSPPPADTNSSSQRLRSTARDNVFMSFVDHGCCQRLLFPDGSLSADELSTIIWSMAARSQFRRLLIFVEACQSGSMFESNILPPNVLAITASNASEASWGVFCPSNDDLIAGKHIGTCLGDMFSVSWMNILGSGEEELGHFLMKVSRVNIKSQVNFYGDSKLLNLPVSEFFGVEVEDSSIVLA